MRKHYLRQAAKLLVLVVGRLWPPESRAPKAGENGDVAEGGTDAEAAGAQRADEEEVSVWEVGRDDDDEGGGANGVALDGLGV